MPPNHSSPLELGPVTAERAFTLFKRDGIALPVSVRLGKPFVGRPFKAPESHEYRCTAQIVGIGDERVVAPWGEDPLVALQYAIDLIGQMLDNLVQRENLEIRFGQTKPAGFGAILRIRPVVLKDDLTKDIWSIRRPVSSTTCPVSCGSNNSARFSTIAIASCAGTTRQKSGSIADSPTLAVRTSNFDWLASFLFGLSRYALAAHFRAKQREMAIFEWLRALMSKARMLGGRPHSALPCPK